MIEYLHINNMVVDLGNKEIVFALNLMKKQSVIVHENGTDTIYFKEDEIHLSPCEVLRILPYISREVRRLVEGYETSN